MAKNSKFNVKQPRIDPYKNYLFRLKWEVKGKWKTVLGASKVHGLKRTTELDRHREGGRNSRVNKAPKCVSYEGITLERGLTTDPEFDKWAHKYNRDHLQLRKNLQLEALNENLKPVLRYNLYGCWISEYNVPELDANANAIAIESIKIELEGWERDSELVEEDE